MPCRAAGSAGAQQALLCSHIATAGGRPLTQHKRLVQRQRESKVQSEQVVSALAKLQHTAWSWRSSGSGMDMVTRQLRICSPALQGGSPAGGS